MESMLKRKVYETRRQKTIDFAIGAAIWLVLNAIFLGITVAVASIPSNDVASSTLYQLAGIAAAILPWVVNIALMVFFAFTRYWIALGMLGMVGAILVLAICAAVLFLGYCFVVMSNPNGF